jgi:hypothetical protein
MIAWYRRRKREVARAALLRRNTGIALRQFKELMKQHGLEATLAEERELQEDYEWLLWLPAFKSLAVRIEALEKQPAALSGD